MLEVLSLKPETFGLDISDLSLKIIKLNKKRKGFDLASFGEQKIKPGVIEAGEVKDEDALIEAIQEGISKVKGERLKTKYVICSLPEEQSFLKVIQMPQLKDKDLKMAVQYEAENYVPFPRDEVYLDSQVILPMRNHLDHKDVLLIAFRKAVVDPYVYCLKKAGLQPVALELESSSIARALIKDESVSQPTLLIDFGKTNTGFIIFSGNSLRFTGSVLVSSEDFTASISHNLKIDIAEAERLKIKYGIDKKSVRGKKVLKALTPSLTDALKQIKKYLNFYKTHTSREYLSDRCDGVQKIILCGGGSSLKGLTDFLSLELGIPIEIGNPWINVLANSKKGASKLSIEESLKYTTAIGLALRGIKDKNSI